MSKMFYWISGSPWAWRAMLALEYKGVQYDSQRLNPSEGEHRTPEYLEINPRGRVPALRDGETVVYESLAILAYLDQLIPEPNLLGANAGEAAAIMQRICELDNYTYGIFMGLAGPILFSSKDPQLADLENAISATHEELSSLETHLATNDYLAGERVTAADISFVPMLNYVIRAAEKQAIDGADFGFLPLANHYPAIASWLRRMAAIPGYEAAYPPHWRD